MKIAVTGGTGVVGWFIVEHALRRGHSVTVMSRNPPPRGMFSGPIGYAPFDLGRPDCSFLGYDALVHAAFSHLPGKYRGGEGDDPEGFRRMNLDGTLAVFKAAERASVSRIVFISSRAVYGAFPHGTFLHESLSPRPDTIYGQTKLEAETALAAANTIGVSLRVTGVYGASAGIHLNKWKPLFQQFANGAVIPPRAGTEVHGDDVANAVDIILTAPANQVRGRVFCVSDFVLDRRDLLAAYAEISGSSGQLPPRADIDALNVMDTQRLRSLGWTPKGPDYLATELPAILGH